MKFNGNSICDFKVHDTLKYKKTDSAGNSSSEDERLEQDYYQLRRVASSFEPDTFKGFLAL